MATAFIPSAAPIIVWLVAVTSNLGNLPKVVILSVRGTNVRWRRPRQWAMMVE